MTTTPGAEIQEYIAQCNGCDNYYKHLFGRGTVYTSGVKFVADKAGAYWLIDAIMSHHKTPKVLKVCNGFQHWKLTKNKKGDGFRLVCTDGGQDGNVEKVAVTQRIEWSDFPLDSIEFYLENGVLMLTAER